MAKQELNDFNDDEEASTNSNADYYKNTTVVVVATACVAVGDQSFTAEDCTVCHCCNN